MLTNIGPQGDYHVGHQSAEGPCMACTGFQKEMNSQVLASITSPGPRDLMINCTLQEAWQPVTGRPPLQLINSRQR